MAQSAVYSVPPELTSEQEDELQRFDPLFNALFNAPVGRVHRRRYKLQKSRMRADSDSDAETGGMALTHGIGELGIYDASKPVLTPDGSTPPDGNGEKKKELVKLDPALIGMSVGLKHMYSGKEDKLGRFQWQTTIPKDVGKPAEDAETQKWAILVRNVKVYNDPRKVLSIHSVVVQSPLLKELLGAVLKGYPDVTAGLRRLEFSGRFEPLIHRFAELKSAIDNLKAANESGDGDEKAEDRIKHAELLYDLLATEFKHEIDASRDMKNKGVMTYEHLWTLFQPGSMVYSKQLGQDRVFRLHSSRYGHDLNGNPVFWLTCQYVDYDGTRFGTNKLNVCIPCFGGTHPISSLPCFPFENHSAAEELKAKLVERGSKVESFAGSHYRAYNGMGWRLGNMGVKEKYSVKGRIVIDTYGWSRFNPNMAIFVTPLHINDGGGITSTSNNYSDGSVDYDEEIGGDVDSDGGMPMDGFFADEEEVSTARQSLSAEQKLITSPLVRGYALKEKMWLNFFVNAVHDISFNDRAFDSLVLPANQKELILGFTATQQSHRSQFDDVIEGKGRGIILLLCGPPGVGKTLTAESVAEEMKVPLYMMSAGDLGLDPRHVEAKLQGILDMCTRWNAILLLDEADVFLEERSLHELERNKLVSIFLRILEYYEGIMFLTTNRVQTFDAAFQSRIHISLDYPELSIESRRTVWTNFLNHHDVAQASARDRPPKPPASAISTQIATTPAVERTAAENAAAGEEAHKLHLAHTLPHTITSRDLDSLCLMNMNGRQIKNILKTAQLLASKRCEGLNKEHVMTVLDVTQHLHNANKESDRTRNSMFH